ncbi:MULTISPECIES: response regulator [unclassified Pseudomonas]|uniref:response regulator n=1 Tax=unclassified Pseudomonas TaxID=196821 RepID=UPI001913B007|nr:MULTISPECIES: response regulator [unclassified Pseudomonas]MBK5518592.1 response regulator [Pseudomonas sp. TH10]MCA4963081.1 response regulator [Pseudomonas sp. Y24-6]
MTLRVVIADDHPITLMGVRAVLKSQSALKIVGEAQSVETLLDLLHQQPCELLVTDLNMPCDRQMDGLRLIQRLRRYYPDMAIVVVTMLDNPTLTAQLLKMNISGLVSKRGLLNDLPKAINHRGEQPFMSPSIQQLLSVSHDSSQQLHKLTAREVEVLRLIGSGLSVSMIAQHLCRSKQTISTQKISAMRKLGVDTAAALFTHIKACGLA